MEEDFINIYDLKLVVIMGLVGMKLAGMESSIHRLLSQVYLALMIF